MSEVRKPLPGIAALNNVYDIDLPSEKVIVTGRILNWLKNTAHLKPASCIVTSILDTEDFSDFFLKIANYLAESAGVSITCDNLHRRFEAQKKRLDKKLGAHKHGNGMLFQLTPPLDIPEGYQVLKVADSLRLSSEKSQKEFPPSEGFISIFDALYYASSIDLYGRKILLDFSHIRDKDEYSSGNISFYLLAKELHEFVFNPNIKKFLHCCSSICSTIKKGGLLRNGAMTATIYLGNPLTKEYLDIKFEELSHIKKGVTFEKDLPPLDVLLQVIKLQNEGSLFFEKTVGESLTKDGKLEELRINVCRAIYLVNDDQCLVSPVNLGQCYNYDDIKSAIVEATNFLISVYEKQEELQHPLRDKQIAVGFAGLANLLRHFGVSYPTFIDALSYVNTTIEKEGRVKEIYLENKELERAINICVAISNGITQASIIALKKEFRAAFAVEPTESCTRRNTGFRAVLDQIGKSVVPNIDPPNVIPGVGIEKRHSEYGIWDNDGNRVLTEYDFGADIFPASYLTERQHFELWHQFYKLINVDGLAHGVCYEQWFPLDLNSFYQWWNSDLRTIYYNRAIKAKSIQKGADDRIKNLRKAKAKIENVCTLEDREAGCEACG